MPRRSVSKPQSETPVSHATWRDPDDGRVPELDELCPTSHDGWLLYCESHDMHAHVGREREGRLMGEAHALFMADGCDLYLRRIVDQHVRETVVDGFAGEEGEPLEPLPSLAD